MIESIGSTSLFPVSTTQSGNDSTNSGSSFDAALEAQQKKDAKKQAAQSDFDAIREKGFTAWARETQIEALKEKLRKKIMSEMGVDEDSLSKLSSVMQEILRKKIEEEVESRLAEEMAKSDTEKTAQNGQQNSDTQSQTTRTTQTAQNTQTGKNDRDESGVPVIPALSWPGGGSLF